MSGQDRRLGMVPYNLDSEKSVLAASILSEESLHVAIGSLRPEDFYEPRHRLIYQAIQSLYTENRAVDLVTVYERLESQKQAQSIGGMAYLTELQQQPYLLKNTADYVGIVREKSTLRKMISELTEVVELCREGQDSSETLLDLCAQRILNLHEDRNSDTERISEILTRQMTDFVNGSPAHPTLASGFGDLDAQIGGLRPGTLTILAARPAMGKSALALNIATQAAVHQEKTVVVFSLEMSKEEIATRIVSAYATIEPGILTKGRVSESVMETVSKAYTRMYGTNLFINDRSGTSPTEMLSKCRQLKMQYGLDLIIVDYLQLMNVSRQHRENRQQEISEISRSMKLLAKELQVPVIALSQLSRACEARENKRPLLSDLRESGSLEQDADVVMFLYRDQYYNKDAPVSDHEISEIIIAKNRAGATGTVKVGWLSRYTRFYDLKTDHLQPPAEPPKSVDASVWKPMLSPATSSHPGPMENTDLPLPEWSDSDPPGILEDADSVSEESSWMDEAPF